MDQFKYDINYSTSAIKLFSKSSPVEITIIFSATNDMLANENYYFL